MTPLRKSLALCFAAALLPLGCHKDAAPASGAKAGATASHHARGSHGPVAVKTVTVTHKLAPRPVDIIATLTGKAQADVYPKVTGRVTFMGPKEGEKVRAHEVIAKIDRSEPGETFLNTPVQSPIAGWLGRWAITNVGEQVSPQASIATIVDDTALRARVFLPTADWTAVRHDTPATITVEGESRPARIIAIARAAEEDSGRGSVQVEVDNKERTWRVGTPAHVRLQLDEKPRMLVDAMALSITDQGAFVYAIDGNKAVRKTVQFIVITDDEIEVTSGLDDGAQVVVAGNNLLSDGSEVHIVKDEVSSR